MLGTAMNIIELTSLIAEVTGKSDFDLDGSETFEEISMTSIDVMELIALIETEYGLRVDFSKLAADKTVHGLLCSID